MIAGVFRQSFSFMPPGLRMLGAAEMGLGYLIFSGAEVRRLQCRPGKGIPGSRRGEASLYEPAAKCNPEKYIYTHIIIYPRRWEIMCSEENCAIFQGKIKACVNCVQTFDFEGISFGDVTTEMTLHI